jgi:hypothetical protein
MKIKLFLEDIIQEYNLCNKVDATGNVHCKVRQGMYGLLQAGIIAQELLEERLLKAGYGQSKVTPGYWKHNWRPISFTLVVGDFELNTLTRLTSTTSSKHLSKTMKLKKTGKELGISASHSIGTTRNVKSTSPCPATLNEHSPDSDILSPKYFNINHTNILFPPTEPQSNMPKMTMPQNYF